MRKLSVFILLLALLCSLYAAVSAENLNYYFTASFSASPKFYTGPGTNYIRANNGKASVSTNGAVYALGYENGWMLMLYEANYAGQYRVGYIETSRIKGKLPTLDNLSWKYEQVALNSSVSLTDDPALTGRSIAYLPA